MSRIRRIAAFALVVATLVIGVGLATSQSSPASAGGATYATTVRTKTIISARCYHTHQITTTYYHFSTRLQHYVRYPSPRITTADYNTCHAASAVSLASAVVARPKVPLPRGFHWKWATKAQASDCGKSLPAILIWTNGGTTTSIVCRDGSSYSS